MVTLSCPVNSTRAVKRWHTVVAHDSSSQTVSQTVLMPELTTLYPSGLRLLTMLRTPALEQLPFEPL